MVLPGSRAATLPTVSLYSISNSKSNLMLPAAAAEGVDMDCEGLMKARKVPVALTREHLTPLFHSCTSEVVPTSPIFVPNTG